jgi:hypothetical protein
MSQSQSEYLRNKQRRTQKIFGRAQMGDESTRMMVHRFRSSTIRSSPNSTIQCCRSYPNGVGHAQESSRDRITSSSAGCEICAVGMPRVKFSIVDTTYVPSIQTAAARIGKQTCCANPPYVPRDPPPCCPDTSSLDVLAAPSLGVCCEAPVKVVSTTIPCCDNPIYLY